MSSEESFCGATLENLDSYYSENIQDYIDIPICIIGVIFNILNILVFTRRNMKSPVNLIFTHLAIVSLSELLAYASFIWVRVHIAYYSKRTNYEEWTYTRAWISMLSSELLNISNRISVYIVMMLAIWKYIAVFHPSKESQWCNMKTTRYTVVAGYIVCILLFIPEYLSPYIYKRAIGPTTIYIFSIEIDSIMYTASQVIKIALHELLPSLVLPILGVRLIATLWMKKEHPTPSSNVENSTDNVEMKRQTNRSIIISMIMVAQCLSFVIPTGLLDLARYTVLAEYYFSIHFKCTNSFYVILNILECINKCITFIVYYALDRDFKVTFKSLVNKKNAAVWKLNYVSSSSTRGNDGSLEIDRI
ncbi:G-protein coupled receptor dmsr-1-like [Planococcus citri]|uniref:G-protein coupled receptor dmsr-1-like n=1 Tax=Planococcus citri TaxID=170843 RepID=UPI0031F77105